MNRSYGVRRRFAGPGALLCLLLIVMPLQADMGEFDRGEAGFSILANGLEIPYREFALFLLPGKNLELRAGVRLELEAKAGHARETAGGWNWLAPAQVGHYPILLRHGRQSMRLQVFVMRPASEIRDERLGEYKIGSYSRKPFRGLAAYRPPRGFIEVSPELRQMRVSPHFTLGQFLCKQESGWPKYLLLRPELLLKLERLLARVNEAGIRTDSFEVMSGFRTPWYNRAIGNRTSSSRHLYGGAADIYIDVAPRDGVMDDLNGDGRSNKADADFLYDLFDKWSGKPRLRDLSGGLASYRANPVHGPFVHLDARGYRARWGR